MGKDFWKDYPTFNISQRRKFLKSHGMNKRAIPHCIDCKHPFYHCVCHDLAFQARKKEKIAKMYASFDDKILYSIALKDQVMREHKGERIYVAYSGGIDSECCAWLFRDEIKQGLVKVLWNDTLVELPETRKRVADFEREYNTKVMRITPIDGWSFRKVVEVYGLPMFARSADADKRKATERCCYHLKKQPTEKTVGKIDVLIMGLRLKESRYRAKSIFQFGDYFYAKKSKQWRVYPIAYWNNKEPWEYQAREGFPYNVIYTMTNTENRGEYLLPNGKIYHIRTGCWCCPQGIRLGYLEWLRVYYPKYHHALLFKFKLLDKVIELRKTELRFKNIHICGMD